MRKRPDPDRTKDAREAAPDVYDTVLPAKASCVRTTVQEIATFATRLGLTDGDRDTVNLVIAEVLNNIVEHAYRGTSEGTICVRCQFRSRSLQVDVTDQGSALPNGMLPDTHLPDVGGHTQDLPEGGFGWFMIRHLCRETQYWRDQDRNNLRLVIPFQFVSA